MSTNLFAQNKAQIDFVETQFELLDLMTTSHLVEDSILKKITVLEKIAEHSSSVTMQKIIPSIEKFNNNQPAEALRLCYELLYLNTSLNKLDSIAIYQNIGAIYNSLNETEIAIRNIELAIQLREQAGLNVQKLANWLMAIYYYAGNIEKSITAVKKNLNLSNKEENLNAYINLGLRYSELPKSSDSAIHYLQLALNISPEKLVLDDYTFIYLGLGNTYKSVDNKDSALHYYKRTIADTNGMGNWYPYTVANQKIAEIYLEKNKKDSALTYLENFFLCPCLGNETNAWLHHEKANAYKKLGRIELYQKELEEAYRFQTLYLEEVQQQDRLVSGINSSSLRLIEENIKSLDQKNKAFAQKNKTFLFLVITLIILIITLVLFFIFRSKKKKQIFQIQQSLNKAKIEQAELEKTQMREKVKYQNMDLSQMASSIALKQEILQQQHDKLSSILNEDAKTEKLQAHLRELKSLLNIDQNITVLQGSMDSVNNTFIEKLKNAYPALTKNDIEICSLHLLGLSSKEIATMRGVSPKAIQTNRYRIKKKMNLSEDVDFLQYLKKFSS